MAEMNISAPSGLVHITHVDTEMNWKRSDSQSDFSGSQSMWKLDNKLGEGAYGSVYKGTHIETGFEVAISRPSKCPTSVTASCAKWTFCAS